MVKCLAQKGLESLNGIHDEISADDFHQDYLLQANYLLRLL
jgi:hypothetical protein